MSTSTHTGVDALQTINFQRNYLWELVIAYDTPTLSGFDVGTLAQAVAFGEYSVESNKMRVGPYTSFFAGLLTVQVFRVTFLVPNPNVLVDYFDSWKDLMVGNDGLFFPKTNYMKNMYLRLLDRDGTITGQYKLIGCFPTGFPYYQLDYGTNGLAKVPMVFAVDKIEYTDLSSADN